MAHILVVDGDVVARTVVRTLLEDSGHSVEEVDGAGQALTRMHERLPDLVLTEAHLEGMEGIQFLRKIRSIWPQEQVVVMAGASSIGLANLADLTKQLGAVGFLQKPVDRGSLGSVLDRLLAS